MSKSVWSNKSIVKFIDDNKTKFTKGSYEFGDNVYTWKLEDEQGTDYCNLDQLILWDVQIKKDLSESVVKKDLSA